MVSISQRSLKPRRYWYVVFLFLPLVPGVSVKKQFFDSEVNGVGRYIFDDGAPCYVYGRYSGHATTFEAAVHGFGSVQELKRIRKEVKAKFPPPQVSGTFRNHQ